MKKIKKLKIIISVLVIIFAASGTIIPAFAESREVIVGGEAFGLKLYCRGVIVTGFEEFISSGKRVCPAKACGLKLNDIITEADGKSVSGNKMINDVIKKSKGKPIELKILRGENESKLILKARKNPEGIYFAGFWVRDSCAGIGTITYFDKAKKSYGALGHGICDADTGGLMQNSFGEILTAEITSVTKSKNNSIGSLNGFFTENKIGSISKNTPLGIFGIATKFTDNRVMKTAEPYEIKTGKATLISTIDGTEPKEYSINIIQIRDKSADSNKNFVVEITDSRLLKNTGGIVQGMSGSPILQNGKLVGALTHVFLEDSKKGYGIFAENMITREKE